MFNPKWNTWILWKVLRNLIFSPFLTVLMLAAFQLSLGLSGLRCYHKFVTSVFKVLFSVGAPQFVKTVPLSSFSGCCKTLSLVPFKNNRNELAVSLRSVFSWYLCRYFCSFAPEVIWTFRISFSYLKHSLTVENIVQLGQSRNWWLGESSPLPAKSLCSKNTKLLLLIWVKPGQNIGKSAYLCAWLIGESE